MKVAYSLKRIEDVASATAFLLPSPHARDLFELLERLRLDPLPAVFATADGFLVRLAIPHAGPIAGVIRLRAIARNFYLPVDAQLTPPLLTDEAEGVTSRRGLVVLAGPRFLEFAPDSAVEWGRLLRTDEEGKLGSLPPRNWSALPEAPEIAEGLVELASSVVPPSAETILEQGRDDIGTESPRPEGAANLGQRVLGTSLFVTGHLVTWLGMKLGLAGIAGKGADMLQRALDKVPRLSEFLMNQQEAILRALLNDFREGRIEEALRRALPLGGPASQPVAPSGGTTLPWNSFIHSLDNLIGRHPGAAGGWFTPDDVYRSLQAEYRKHAEEAARRGDVRRAAFIYAKLLYDLPAAARVLSAGGLHRDAAIVYEKALNNPRAAATEWEAAGEIDRAVDLLVGLSDPLAAAEVLQRAGEEARALVLFNDAAMKLWVAGKHFEAGELMRTKARRPELALALFRDGWKLRPLLGSIPCGQALASHYAEEPNPTRFRDLVRDAKESSIEWPADAVVTFFNAIVRQSNRPELAAVQDEVHDYSLLSLAAKMAQAKNVDKFFEADSPWPNPIVRDAQFALGRRPSVVTAHPIVELARPGPSVVRAVCRMPRSGDVFLGFGNGEIVRNNPEIGTSRTIHRCAGKILGLECDFEEETLFAVTASSSGIHCALTGKRGSDFEMRVLRQNPAGVPMQLLRPIENQPSKYFGIISGDHVEIFRPDSPLLLKTYGPFPNPTAGIVGSSKEEGPWVLLFSGPEMRWMIRGHVFEGTCEAWPDAESKSTLHQPPLFGRLVAPGEAQITWNSRWVAYSMTIRFDDPIFDELDPIRIAQPKQPPAPAIHGFNQSNLSHADQSALLDHLNKERKLGRLVNPVAAFVQKGGDFLIVEANGSIRLLPRS